MRFNSYQDASDYLFQKYAVWDLVEIDEFRAALRPLLARRGHWICRPRFELAELRSTPPYHLLNLVLYLMRSRAEEGDGALAPRYGFLAAEIVKAFPFEPFQCRAEAKIAESLVLLHRSDRGREAVLEMVEVLAVVHESGVN